MQTEQSNQHSHEWKETKTFIVGGGKDTYVLSRDCPTCGECECYHGSQKVWIRAGNINDPKWSAK